MTFADKIEEWMKEVEARPESAVTLVRLALKRLRELTERNEELLAENIALQHGTRIEEYQKRIVHLEYQLDMLKQRFGADSSALENLPAQSKTAALSLLVYNARGRIFRAEIDSETQAVGQIAGEMVIDKEPPRMLAVTSNENLLLLFTSGRVETLAVSELPAVQIGGTWEWNQAALPHEPRAGELLACIAPFSRLPLSDFILQISRRGFAKKTLTSISESILDKHYVGKGATEKSDQPFDLTLANKNNLAALVTYEGKVTAFDVEKLSYSPKERIKLGALDYVIGSFILEKETALLCMTQTGKVIHRGAENIEAAKSSATKGQALIPPSRLEQGIRFMSAVAIKDEKQIAVLDAAGGIKLHDIEIITGSGAIQTEGLILSATLIPATEEKARG